MHAMRGSRGGSRPELAAGRCSPRSRRRLAWAAAGLLILTVLVGGANAGAALAQEEQEQATPAAGERSITVIGYGGATVPAEIATVQMLFSTQEAFAGPFPRLGPDDTLGEAEREAAEPIVQAIVDAGISEETVRVLTSPALSGFGGSGGRGVFRLDLTVEDEALNLERMNELVNAAGQAAAVEGITLTFVGARYDVADCGPVTREALQSANDDTRARAEEQAELMGVELGEALRSSEVAAPSGGGFSPYPGILPSVRGGCDPVIDPSVSFGPGTSFSVPAFDPTVETEVDVYTQVIVTYAVSDSGGA